MPFPPETIGRVVRLTPPASQAGFQPSESASGAGAALEAGGNLAALVAALASTLSVKQSLIAVSDLSEVAIDFNTATTVSLVSATAAKTARVHKLFVMVGGTTNLTFQSASTALHGILPMQAGGSFTLDFDERAWFTTAVNEALQLTSSAAVQVSGRVYYVKS